MRGIKKSHVILLLILFALACLGAVGLPESEIIRIENPSQPEDSSPEETAPSPEPSAGEKSALTGLSCPNPQTRPIAVMLGGDAESRPLSGLLEADVVVEMPVVTSSITRYMAVYGCQRPEEIGNVRSARHDFIPLARGFDAILAHWGGSHFALDQLNAGVMDNINALYLDGTVFFRKLGKFAPFNGFTSFARLEKYAAGRGYRSTSNFAGYKFLAKSEPAPTKGRLTIGYPGSFRVEYDYDPSTDSYLRFKGGTRELDKGTGTQVAAKNVAIMYAASRQLEGQYNDVDVEGEGAAVVYRGGKEVRGRWSKNKADPASRLIFSDETGEEIAFVPGQIWIQVVQPNQKVEWTAGF